MPTPLRNVRVPDEVWQAAQARAAAEGTSVSAVVVAALREYGVTPDTSRPKEHS